MSRHNWWLALAIALGFGTGAQAQSFQCTVPGRVTLPPPPRIDGPVRRTAIGSYTLAASWSPEFCNGRKDQAGSMQCSGRNGRFGFVLHGLWPEAAFGPPPQWCAALPRPTPDDLRANLCMSPSASLLEREWAKHGSCMAPTPGAYFTQARTLWQRLRWPDADALSRQPGLTVGDLRRAFLAVNPGWTAQGVAIDLSNRGWLREVRLCYSRAFAPRSCNPGQRGAPDSRPLRIWRGL